MTTVIPETLNRQALHFRFLNNQFIGFKHECVQMP